jgi:AbrB family looped-hinge helix DNA binding protein
MRITAKGQVTIPVAIRDRLGLLPGAVVEFSIDGDAVRLTKAPTQEGRGTSLVSRMRGSARSELSTDEIMALTRG